MTSGDQENDTGRPWLSVVLPFYRKLAEFKRVLPMNAGYWARPGIEVVLALDEPGEEAGVLALIERIPQIRWKVLVNDIAHAWRPPCKAINAGVRCSAGRFVLVHSPESAYVGDAPALLLQAAMGHARGVAVGRVGFARFDELTDTLDAAFAREVPPELLLQTFYGSLCCAREAFDAVHGYDESFEEWGGDDDNLRVRLEMAGWQLLACPDAHLLHLSDETRTGGEQFDRDVDWIRCTPHEARVGDAGWGRDFHRIAHDDSASAWPAEAPAWLINTPVVPMGSRRQCEVCARLLHHEASAFHCPQCGSPPVAPRLTSRLRIVCVLQVRNEARYLPGCLDHLRGHVDGIVALDDGSTDGTADILRRDPMLLELLSNLPRDDGAHVWRENENKRRLLEAARRHGAGWVLVCDADERYEQLFLRHLHATVDSLPDHQLASLSLVSCELWNSPDAWRIDGPWGRKSRARLFRLPQQIAFDQSPTLHGTWLPDDAQRHGLMFYSRYRLYHLKSIRHEDRVARRDLYTRLDPARQFQAIGYDYLAEEGPGLQLMRIAPDRDYDRSTLPPDLQSAQPPSPSVLAKSPR
ncbi:glycosyltransferase family 2 protein [Variovorax boronicumulans]